MNTINKNLTVVVHDGIFHADDVICVALLKVANPSSKINVVRTRKPFVGADFVLDVGGKTGIEGGTVFLDHHERNEEKAVYSNGIQYAACGKLLEFLGLPEGLLSRGLYAVQAIDNGQKELAAELPNPFSYISTFNVEWDRNINGPEQQTAFDRAVEITVEVIHNLLASIELEERGRDIVLSAINESINTYSIPGVLVLPQYVGGWQKYVCEHNERALAEGQDMILTVVFPSSSGGYNCQVVPKSANSFESYVLMREHWRGLRGVDLEKASRISGAVFCHPAGFLSGWQTEEGAIEAAVESIARM